MVPKNKSKSSVDLPVSVGNTASDRNGIPTKAKILKDISEGYSFVMSGGKGQPIDDMHREIAEEFARPSLVDLLKLAY